SFHVVEDKGFYHCFGCGVHGDVISFAMQTADLTFPEAVEDLARQAGLEVPLHGPQGREARQYLERRGLDLAAIRRFRLGYAPESRDALKRALSRDFPEALLIEAGLLRRPEGGGD